MTCKKCIERGKTWEGSNPICAFDREDNWNCATIGLLRDLVDEGSNLPVGVDYQYCEDMKYATIKVDHIDDLDGALALWVCWYKQRGRTDNFLLLFSDGEPRKPNEQEILTIVEFYKAANG